MVYHNHAYYYVSVYLLHSYLIHCTGLTTWSSGIKWPIKHNELKGVMMIHSTWIDVELRRAIQTLLDLQSSTAFTSATRDITSWEMICCIFSTSSGSFFFSLVTIETYSENTTIALLYSLATADTVSFSTSTWHDWVMLYIFFMLQPPLPMIFPTDTPAGTGKLSLYVFLLKQYHKYL